jgi:NADH:ubiquinone oxidoreductase subunit 4 (subunit M)
MMPFILITGFCSLIWGAFTAYVTTNLKKFVAYTSLNNYGLLFIICSFNFNNFLFIFLFALFYLIIYNYYSFFFLENL